VGHVNVNVDGISHAMLFRDNGHHFGITECGLQFTWTPTDAIGCVRIAKPSDREVDCMECITEEAL
jgi:hypothetical protein